MNLLIIGAGQYGLLVKEMAQSVGGYEKINFIDDNSPLSIGKIADIESFYPEYDSVIVAIGSAETRKMLLDKLKRMSFNIVTLVHPLAYVSPSAKIGKGCVVEPMAVINTDVQIGLGCLISAGAIINHNAIIEEYCHIDCGSVVGARVIVSKCTATKYGEIISE